MEFLFGLAILFIGWRVLQFLVTDPIEYEEDMRERKRKEKRGGS